METKVKFRSKGVVYGKYWGSGKGSYPARKLEANTKEELMKQANDGLDGSLDSGMGYESLIGAFIQIQKETTIIVDDKPYINFEYECEFIGKLTDEEKEILEDAYCDYYLKIKRNGNRY